MQVFTLVFNLLAFSPLHAYMKIFVLSYSDHKRLRRNPGAMDSHRVKPSVIDITRHSRIHPPAPCIPGTTSLPELSPAIYL